MSVFIKSIGHYLPDKLLENTEFLLQNFRFKGSSLMPEADSASIVEKFEEVTGIKSRYYRNQNETASQMGIYAAKNAMDKANVDAQELELIIFAHNWGDQKYVDGKIQYDMLPNLASKVKHELNIDSMDCTAFDINFGCTGFIEGLKIAEALMIVQNKKLALVIGADTVSSVIDPEDINSMLFGDGAGAAVLSSQTSEGINAEIICSKTFSICKADNKYLRMEKTTPQNSNNNLRLKMDGTKVFQTAIHFVPELLKSMFHDSNMSPSDMKYLILHQANPKMMHCLKAKISQELGLPNDSYMPVMVDKMGNNSVASIPIVLSSLMKNAFDFPAPQTKDKLFLCSFGAGMHVNGMVLELN